MDMQSLVGKTVRLTLAGIDVQDPYIRPKIGSGEETFTLVTQIDSVDELGVWILVHDYPVYNNVERKKEEHNALMLLRYDFIVSVVHFPELAEDDSKRHRIGFGTDDDL